MSVSRYAHARKSAPAFSQTTNVATNAVQQKAVDAAIHWCRPLSRLPPLNDGRWLIVVLATGGADPEDLIRVDIGPRVVVAHGRGWEACFRPLTAAIDYFGSAGQTAMAEQITGAADLGGHVILAVDDEGGWRAAALVDVDMAKAGAA